MSIADYVYEVRSRRAAEEKIVELAKELLLDSFSGASEARGVDGVAVRFAKDDLHMKYHIEGMQEVHRRLNGMSAVDYILVMAALIKDSARALPKDSVIGDMGLFRDSRISREILDGYFTNNHRNSKTAWEKIDMVKGRALVMG